MKNEALFAPVGFYPADILLPRCRSMEKWAVVACDQFTSQPEYWEAVDRFVGDAPSTLRLILPEARLGGAEVEKDIADINAAMRRYLEQGIFETRKDALFYIERTQSDGKVRHGLIGMVDLEDYDFTPSCSALIRATEGTVLERIPPRVRVRQNASLELPHVMLLIDDPEKTVIEPLTERKHSMDALYDFDLQQGGGHITGWCLSEAQQEQVAHALRAMCSEDAMEKKYGMRVSPLLFAVGDGNHSLATAKQCYENLKKVTPREQWAKLPARYALVEVVNNHDDALQFEPIHRCVFGVEPEKVLSALKAFYPGTYEGRGEGHVIGYTYAGGSGVLTVPAPKAQLAVGTLQAFLDDYLRRCGGEVDYIHGEDVVEALGSKPGNLGFILPAMGKQQLFKTVIADGVLPRKTFSMGHAQDKRYYLEARKIL